MLSNYCIFFKLKKISQLNDNAENRIYYTRMSQAKHFLKDKNILVIDDERDLRELLSDELKDLGGVIREAENVSVALDLMRAQFFDIILTDMKMPGGTGQDILKSVNQPNEKRSIVVIITGQSEISSEDIYDLGADAIFTKPYDMQLLVDALDFLIQTPEKRWTRAHQRIETDFTVSIQLENLSSALNTKTLNIGRGGMCIEIPQGYPSVGQIVNFNIHSKTGKNLEGVGRCKWINSQKEKTFVGLEFLGIDRTGIEEVIEYIKKNHPRSYIPKRTF